MNTLNPRLSAGDLGRAFPQLVFEALSLVHPRLVQIDPRGKDGGIDLSETRDSSRAFIECKYVGENGPSAAHARWREVASRLEKHLSSATGPTKGQAQYTPWYRTTPALTDYTFCVSSSIGNQRRRDALREEIVNFFASLAIEHSHLAHLKSMRVDLLDWVTLSPIIERQPHIIYRWFPATRPVGAVPLSEPLSAGPFRSYLQSTQLPYFSLESYSASRDDPLPVESTLVDALDSDYGGLLITGRGGVGKTRLMLELGRVALEKDWTVLRVLPSFDRDGLLQVAETATPSSGVVLLVDYVELQTDFDELASLARDLNETYDLRIRFIANCRTTYYPRLASLPDQLRIDVSPPAATASAATYQRYRRETVRHILSTSGITPSPTALEICRDTPVLAVFLSYLAATGRIADLTELLGERDFGSWVAKRVQMSFRDPIQHDLVTLVGMLPIPIETANGLGETLSRLLDVLAADGWTEREDGPATVPQFVMAHDVLADQILVAYLNEFAATAEVFVRNLLKTAESFGQLQSTLLALQRVAAEPSLAAVDWLHVITEQVSQNPQAWQTSGQMLLTSQLLQPEEQLELLSRLDGLWDSDVTHIDVQNRIGWLCRWALHREDDGDAVEQRAILEKWALAAASAATTVNFVVTWALRLTPTRARQSAEAWIEAHRLEFQTHYVLVAWLEVGFPPSEIASAVTEWLTKFKNLPRLTFLVRAWLNSGGEHELVGDVLEHWLKQHAALPDAVFIYTSWLDSGGDPSFLREPMKQWLKVNGRVPSAGRIYRAWLMAGGSPNEITGALREWLADNAEANEAMFVYTAWLDVGAPLEFVAEAISDWFTDPPRTADQWVLRAWLDAGGGSDFVRDAVVSWLREYSTLPEASFIYRAWLDRGGELELVREPIRQWLGDHSLLDDAGFVFKGWLDRGGELAVVETAFARWLPEHALERDAQFAYRSWLDAGGDRRTVRKPITRWLAEHALSAEAGFVYKGWLNAGGDLDCVQDAMSSWLRARSQDPETDYVLSAWFGAGGSFEAVRQPVLDWIHANRDRQSASYLLKHVVREDDLPLQAVIDVLHWCTNYPTDEDALWRLTGLGARNLFRTGVGDSLLEAAEAIISMLTPDPTPTLRGQVTALISLLIGARELSLTDYFQRVDALIVTWLRHPLSYGRDPKPHHAIQRATYVHRVVEIIRRDPDKDGLGDGVRRFLDWVDEWSPDRRAEVTKQLDELRVLAGEGSAQNPG